VSGIILCDCSVVSAKEKTAAERGRYAVVHWSLNPSLWPRETYDDVWKQWGVKEKPADYDRLFRERYGLHPSPVENNGLPMGLVEAGGLFGKGIVNSCLMCHAGSFAGQSIIGMPNASLDLQGLFDELGDTAGRKPTFPFRFSYGRGTIDPINPVTFLMELRDANLDLQKPVKLDYFKGVSSDPPAWWLLKKKKTRDWTGGIDVRSTRVDMANLLTPLNTGEYIKNQETVFADIGAFLLTIEAPKYPFPINKELAARGEELFVATCAQCHGTYGREWTYPNKIVPLAKIGTDPALAETFSQKNLDYYNNTWFAKELSPDGKPMVLRDTRGYQAPPLDGLWATAPYFHNGSVPTVYHVLNSRARPRYYTRSYQTGKEDFDPVNLGWKITVPDGPADPKLPGIERRKVYDTTEQGRSNSGHTYGDKLTEAERMAVIEYLKTL
jgi:mono/diheme cytochrome c family protein